MNEEYDKVINFWFGRVEETIVPSENRARIWFSDDTEVDAMIKNDFQTMLEKATLGYLDHWEKTPRGQLGLILLLDQFARHVYRGTPRAYHNDPKALEICARGIAEEEEHHLSLIERVFYYFPLLHSEDILYQEQSMIAYQMLAELAFSETKVIYDSFLKFASHHLSLIQRFGRFPQRNDALGRISTKEELDYLSKLKSES